MTAEYRPKIELSMSFADKVQEIMAATLLVAHVILVAVHFTGLPESIPIHINYRDEIDGWGSKSFVWLLPAVALFTYVLLSVVNRFPNKFNYPFKIKPENVEQEYYRATRLIRWLKLCIMGLMLVLTWRLLAEVQPGNGYPGPWLSWILFAVVLVSPWVYLAVWGVRNK
jgi:uncharacterized membrane protein